MIFFRYHQPDRRDDAIHQGGLVREPRIGCSIGCIHFRSYGDFERSHGQFRNQHVLQFNTLGPGERWVGQPTRHVVVTFLRGRGDVPLVVL